MIRQTLLFASLLFCMLLSPHQMTMAQTQVAKGLVVDVEDTPLPGVSIYPRDRVNYTYATSEYVDGGDIKYPESYRNWLTLNDFI